MDHSSGTYAEIRVRRESYNFDAHMQLEYPVTLFLESVYVSYSENSKLITVIKRTRSKTMSGKSEETIREFPV